MSICPISHYHFSSKAQNEYACALRPCTDTTRYGQQHRLPIYFYIGDVKQRSSAIKLNLERN